MKIGAIIIHSSSYTNRKKYVDSLLNFFSETPVECKVIEGVITDRILYDARFDEYRQLSKGQIGCALAHLNAMKLALDNDYDYVYIFEDDVEIINNSYDELQNWLNNLPDYDVCQITNIGSAECVGHDGRIHKNTYIKDLKYVTCPYGTQAYYLNKVILKIMYNTQINMMFKNKIHIADGLLIDCEKEPNIFLKIVTPINRDKFFRHSDEISILNNLN